jgi:hypothetical protein
MTEEFNLSNKMNEGKSVILSKTDWFYKEDVKEFIKKFIEKIDKSYEATDGDLFFPSEIKEFIEELAGDKLI